MPVLGIRWFVLSGRCAMLRSQSYLNVEQGRLGTGVGVSMVLGSIVLLCERGVS